MDKVTATLIVGVLAGLIGAFSAVLSHLSMRYQISKQLKESELARIHDLKSRLLPKKLEAMERIWLFLIQIEKDEKFSRESEDMYIRATLWLPESTRVKALSLLRHVDETGPAPAAIASVRTELIGLIDSYLD